MKSFLSWFPLDLVIQVAIDGIAAHVENPDSRKATRLIGIVQKLRAACDLFLSQVHKSANL